ncbi:MAG TPA: tetratricopeptide repeat protein [Methylomirabilota bacterium]|nr:tetratricopeptide repeat protein [Methylomirabilota bacterium]
MHGTRWLGRILAVGALAAALIALALGIGRWRAHGLVEDGAGLVSDEAYLPAARTLARAVAAAPGDARAHYFLGLAYAGLGQDQAALSHARDAVRLAPGEPAYEAGLATLLLDAGRVPEAIVHLRRAAELGPRAADIRLLLADSLRQAGDREGMERQYRIAMRLARGSALGAVAREQLRAAREQLKAAGERPIP